MKKLFILLCLLSLCACTREEKVEILPVEDIVYPESISDTSENVEETQDTESEGDETTENVEEVEENKEGE